jgi:hypothetical protein
MQDVHVKLNPGLPWQKQQSTRRHLSSANCTYRNIWAVLKCGAREGWRRMGV